MSIHVNQTIDHVHIRQEREALEQMYQREAKVQVEARKKKQADAAVMEKAGKKEAKKLRLKGEQEVAIIRGITHVSDMARTNQHMNVFMRRTVETRVFVCQSSSCRM